MIGRLVAVVLVAASLAPRLDEPVCTVSRIVDGDTFYCARRLKVRLLGIDAPERGQGRGRRLAYVWAGNVLVNEAMVQGGWALACAPAEWRHRRC